MLLDHTARRIIAMLQQDGRCANTVIARELGVSEKTIEFHRARIMQRLGVRTREELFAICRAPGAVLPQ